MPHTMQLRPGQVQKKKCMYSSDNHDVRQCSDMTRYIARCVGD